MSFDKTVKNACKPKKDVPKAKYLDPIIQATHTTDGAMIDICKSLGSCLREPKNIVILKALIVLHSMIRQGATDNVLGFLSGSSGQDVLRIKDSVGGGNWEGYSATKTLQTYAIYLEARIVAYKNLRHDPIRVQSENNSNRMSMAGGAGTGGGAGGSAGGRARKLNSLTVDKGLLREVREVQKIVGCLIQCRFFDDDLEDPCSNLACRMIVKDLLVLTQAVNEGVVNLLEHYFEMVKTDAQEALSIYKAFVKQNDKVVDYLNTARRLKNVLDIPVPNLKHAPVSLVRALEEYLHDPDFEQNRLEYRQNMGAADVPTTTRAPSVSPAPAASKPAQSASQPAASSSATLAPPVSTSSTSAPAPTAQRQVNRTIQDFLSSIEEEQKQQQQQQGPGGMGGMGGNNFMTQMGMGNPYGQPQQPMANPFRQSMFPQATGFNPMQAQATGFPGQQPFQQPNMQMMPQQTGFIQPQAMEVLQPPQQNAFIQPQQTGFGQASPFAQPQQTGFGQAPFAQPAPLQPQATGFNPFRQSMIMPQNTGLPFRSPSSENAFTSLPRSTSAPLNSVSSPDPKPLTAQATGTNNPFALPSDRLPKKQAPAGPSLFELAMHKSMSNNMQQQQTGQPSGQPGGAPAPMVPQATGFAGSSIVPFSSRMGNSSLGQSAETNAQPSVTTPGANNAASTGGNSNSFMSDLASAFALTSTSDTSKPSGDNNNTFPGAFGSSGLMNQPTGATNTSSNNLFGQTTGTTAISSPAPATPTSTAGFLQPQATGFAGSSIKPFKPSSNFGSTLVTDMPSSSLSPNQTGFGGLPSQSTGASPSSPFGAGFGSGLGQNQTGNANAGGMKPQATGYNPFGASTNTGNAGMNSNSNNNNNDLMSIFGGGSSQSQQQPQHQAGSPFGQPFGNANGQTGAQTNNTNWMTSF